MSRRACLAAAFVLIGAFANAAGAKTLTYCAEGSPEGFDPALHTDPATLDASSQAVYNRLVQFKPGTTEIVPALAESWDISKDGREYTFRLRPGVRFHTTADFTPARELNADDVIFSFERQWRDDHPFHDYAGGTWPWFDGISLPFALSAIRKVDDRTVTFVLQRPYAPFLADLAMDFASILSKEYADRLLAEGARERLDSQPVGTGPFRLAEYVPGAHVRYDRNPDYWRKPPPIDSLVFDITPDSGVRLEKLKSGACQVIAAPSPADIPAIKAEPGLEVIEAGGLALAFLAFNTTEPPFDRARVRRAIARAIDKDAIVADVFKGAAVAAASPLAPLMPGYDATAAEGHDVEAARQGLAAAGVVNAATRVWVLPAQRPYNPEPLRMAEMIKADLDEVGIAAEIVSAPAEEFLGATLAADRKGSALLGWVSDNGDPDNLLAPLLGCDAVGVSNRALWCNARFDELLNQARVTTDSTARARFYKEAQRILAEEAPIIPIAHGMVAVAAADTVRGLLADPFGRHNFEAVDLVERP
ncbi:MAG TPA: ABC transporter substrate-binding protein [Bauldia sp.]|nr:ABC transporter substrate-binding protein [Bauldia sp.]